MKTPIRITSDGSRGGTRVIDADGESIGNVVSVRWEHVSPNDIPKVTIELLLPELDVTIDGEVQREKITIQGETEPVLEDEKSPIIGDGSRIMN